MATTYSQIVLIRSSFEHELQNVLKLKDRQEVFRVIEYFENRIAELKEEEKECLKIQTSLTK